MMGGAAAMFALELFAQWLRGKVEKDWIEARMKELEPKISAEVRNRTAAIAALQSKGKKAFANVTIRSSRRQTVAGSYGVIDSYPVLSVFHVNIGPDDVNLEGATTHNRSFGDTETVTLFTYSFEVALSTEEVDLFRALMLEHQYYENQMMNKPDAQAMEEQMKVRQRIVNAFGPAAERDVLDAWMWPTFKYKGKKR
jgi:hypothetical protein